MNETAAAKHSARRHVIWSALDFAVIPAGMLAATPFLIRALGLESFGALMLIQALAGFGAVFNFGFGDTALKYVSHYIEKGARKRAAEIAGTIFLLALGSGLAVGLIFLICVPWLAGLFRLHGVAEIQVALSIAAGLVTLRLIEAVCVAALRGALRYDLSGIFTVLTKAANILLITSLAVAGYGLPALVATTAATVATSIAGQFLFAFREIGNVAPRWTPGVFTEIAGFAKWSWLQGIAGIVYANIDRLLIGAFLGPAALGVYAVCLRLAQLLHQAPAAAANFLLPRMSMLSLSETNAAERRALYLSASAAISATAAVAGAFLAVFAHPVLSVWVGAKIADEGHIILAVLALAYGWFAANSIVVYNTLNGMGHVRWQTFISVTNCAIMTAASMLLIPFFGALGAAAARFPEVIYRLAMRIRVGRRLLGGVPIWQAFDFPRIVLVAGGAAWLLLQLLSVEGGAPERLFAAPLNIIIAGLAAAAIFAAAYWLETWMVAREDR